MKLTPEALEAAAVAAETWPDGWWCYDNWFAHEQPHWFSPGKPIPKGSYVALG